MKITERQFSVDAFGRSWLLEGGPSLEDLWGAMNDADFGDERVPYWTELWPSSQLLAGWLFARRCEIANRLCLDAGCGIGFTALIGAYCGAKMAAFDYEPQALALARQNAVANGINIPSFILMDWRQPALRKLQYIWGADIVYEKRYYEPMLQFLAYSLAPDGRVWIAEPDRTIFKPFIELARGAGWQASKVLSRKVSGIYPSQKNTNASLWELRRKDDA